MITVNKDKIEFSAGTTSETVLLSNNKSFKINVVVLRVFVCKSSFILVEVKANKHIHTSHLGY